MSSTPLLDKEIESTRKKKEDAATNLYEVQRGRGSGTGQAAEDKYSFYDNALARLIEAKSMSDKYTEESLIGWAYDKAQAREERKEQRRDLPETVTWQDVPAQKVGTQTSTTISPTGKIQPSQNSISAYTPTYDLSQPNPYEDTSFFSKIKQTAKDYFTLSLYSKAGSQVFTEGNLYGGIGTLASPLQRFFSQRQGDIKTQIQWRGTSFDTPETTPVEFKKISLTERESLKTSIPEFRQTPEYTASKITNETDFKKFKSNQLPIIAGYKGQVNTLTNPVFNTNTIGTTAAIVGTSFAAPVLAGGLVAAQGFSSYTQQAGRGEYLKAGVSLGIAGLGVYGATSTIAKEIDIMKWNRFQKKKFKTVGEEVIRTPKGSYYDVYKVKTIGEEGTIKTITRYPVFRQGETGFSIAGGKSNVDIKFFSFEKGGFYTGRELAKFTARGTFAQGTSGVTSSQGKGIYTTDTGIQKFRFTGFSAPSNVKGTVRVLGGTADKVRFYQTGEVKLLSKVSEVGFIRTAQGTTDVIDLGTTQLVTTTGGTSATAGIATRTARLAIANLKTNIITPSTSTATSSVGVGLINTPTTKQTSQLTFTTPSQNTIEKTKTTTFNIQTPKLETKTEQRFTQPTLNLLQTPKVTDRQYQAPTVVTIQPPKTQQRLRAGTRIGTTPFINVPTLTPGITTPTGTPVIIPPFLLPSFDFGNGGYAKAGGKRYVKYTPSFTALLFKIRGKAAKKGKRGYTGMEFRAIPKGFSFNTGLGRLKTPSNSYSKRKKRNFPQNF